MGKTKELALTSHELFTSAHDAFIQNAEHYQFKFGVEPLWSAVQQLDAKILKADTLRREFRYRELEEGLKEIGTRALAIALVVQQHNEAKK